MLSLATERRTRDFANGPQLRSRERESNFTRQQKTVGGIYIAAAVLDLYQNDRRRVHRCLSAFWYATGPTQQNLGPHCTVNTLDHQSMRIFNFSGGEWSKSSPEAEHNLIPPSFFSLFDENGTEIRALRGSRHAQHDDRAHSRGRRRASAHRPPTSHCNRPPRDGDWPAYDGARHGWSWHAPRRRRRIVFCVGALGRICFRRAHQRRRQRSTRTAKSTSPGPTARSSSSSNSKKGAVAIDSRPAAGEVAAIEVPTVSAASA